MNATLQCLLHVNELSAYFLDEYPNDWINLKNKNKHVESQGNLSRQFYEIVKGVEDDSGYRGNSFNSPTTTVVPRKDTTKFFSNNRNAYSPDEFKRVLGYYNPQFRRFEANDSKDFISYLLPTMHDELNYNGENYSLPIKDSPNQYDQLNAFTFFMDYYNTRNFSIISNIFYGTYENLTQCLECQKMKYDYQKFEFISFGMDDYKNKPFNIYDGFEDNQKIQFFRGDNKFYCHECKKLCETKICCRIIQPPNTLLINIYYGKNKKYQPSKIIFDEEIDITKYVSFNFGSNIRYKLICVCTYLGSSGSYGHYIAFCKHRYTGQWYYFNDSSCSKCSPEETRRGSPYLLFYEKI